jgi:hypothetical protein
VIGRRASRWVGSSRLDPDPDPDPDPDLGRVLVITSATHRVATDR